ISDAERLDPLNISNTGSPGASRSTINDNNVIPMNVGIAWMMRLTTNLVTPLSPSAVLACSLFSVQFHSGMETHLDLLLLFQEKVPLTPKRSPLARKTAVTGWVP